MEMKIEGTTLVKNVHKLKQVLILPFETADLNHIDVMEGVITDIDFKEKLVIVQHIKNKGTVQEQYFMFQVPPSKLRWLRKKQEHTKVVVDSTSYLDEVEDQGIQAPPPKEPKEPKKKFSINRGNPTGIKSEAQSE